MLIRSDPPMICSKKVGVFQQPARTTAGFNQRLLNAWAAVSLAAGQMDLDDLGSQQQILLGSGAGLPGAAEPIVIATGRDFKSLAHCANGVLGFHRVDPLKALLGVSERMPKVFFKISRCWRR